MNSRTVKIVLITILIGLLFGLNLLIQNFGTVYAQAPTSAIATVTSTASGPIVTVKPGQNEEFINVRSGPNALYPKIGVLLIGQQAPAKGKSPLGEWIMIEYPGVQGGVGWVYAPLVNLTPGELPVVEPPPTVTPLYTETIDPTLAAQFIVAAEPTRLPTFTQPAPLVIPTYAEQSVGQIGGNIPIGFVILILLSIGVLVGIFTIFQQR